MLKKSLKGFLTVFVNSRCLRFPDNPFTITLRMSEWKKTRVTIIADGSSWPTIQPTFGDGIVNLRPWRTDDADWVYAACQDTAIQQWTVVPTPYEIAHAEGFVGKLAPTSWSNGKGGHFAVSDVITGALHGCVGLEVLDATSGVAEVGYWTASESRGRGLTTRALRLLTEWAFLELRLVRLELLVLVGNPSSAKVAERVGYSCEGVMAKKVLRHGTRHDVAMYSRTI